MSIAVVTGASAGIGLAVAKKFLSEGFRVFNLSRRPCPDARVQSLAIDLSRSDLAILVKDLLCEELGESTCMNLHLVHNAARLESDSATNTDDEAFEDVIRVNVLAQNTLTRTLLPFMDKDSSVIFVGSTLSEKAVPGSFSYVTSKHAQIGMMRSLCQDLVGTGIHTATICPGFTDTEMLRAHVPNDALASIAESNAFGRLIEPTEIAQTVFWASQNPVINGSVIHANLGQIER